jgi:hypothetical protein
LSDFSAWRFCLNSRYSVMILPGIVPC